MYTLMRGKSKSISIVIDFLCYFEGSIISRGYSHFRMFFYVFESSLLNPQPHKLVFFIGHRSMSLVGQMGTSNLSLLNCLSDLCYNLSMVSSYFITCVGTRLPIVTIGVGNFYHRQSQKKLCLWQNKEYCYKQIVEYESAHHNFEVY